MAKASLGDRVQIRYYAPKVIVDDLMRHAQRLELSFSQVVSTLLTELAGFSKADDEPLPIPHPTTLSPDPSPDAMGTMRCRVPREVVDRITQMAHEKNIPPGSKNSARNTMITRLLARRLGYRINWNPHVNPASRQEHLRLAEHRDLKCTYAEAS